MFPAFLNLESRRVVVVGGGHVAASKLESLLTAGARVTVVAPEIRSEIEREGVEIVRRAFEEHDLDGACGWWRQRRPMSTGKCRRPPRRAVCS